MVRTSKEYLPILNNDNKSFMSFQFNFGLSIRGIKVCWASQSLSIQLRKSSSYIRPKYIDSETQIVYRGLDKFGLILVSKISHLSPERNSFLNVRTSNWWCIIYSTRVVNTTEVFVRQISGIVRFRYLRTRRWYCDMQLARFAAFISCSVGECCF